jgi:hypothetical protein
VREETMRDNAPRPTLAYRGEGEPFEGIEQRLSELQAPLVKAFQKVLNKLSRMKQFGGTASNRAVCRTVNQLATRFGLEVTCWDDELGDWVPVQLRYSTPRGRERPGYFQAGKPGFTAGFAYTGRHWPKLKAAARPEQKG